MFELIQSLITITYMWCAYTIHYIYRYVYVYVSICNTFIYNTNNQQNDIST